jgi:hypothetical protein
MESGDLNGEFKEMCRDFVDFWSKDCAKGMNFGKFFAPTLLNNLKIRALLCWFVVSIFYGSDYLFMWECDERR